MPWMKESDSSYFESCAKYIPIIDANKKKINHFLLVNDTSMYKSCETLASSFEIVARRSVPFLKTCGHYDVGGGRIKLYFICKETDLPWDFSHELEWNSSCTV